MFEKKYKSLVKKKPKKTAVDIPVVDTKGEALEPQNAPKKSGIFTEEGPSQAQKDRKRRLLEQFRGKKNEAVSAPSSLEFVPHKESDSDLSDSSDDNGLGLISIIPSKSPSKDASGIKDSLGSATTSKASSPMVSQPSRTNTSSPFSQGDEKLLEKLSAMRKTKSPSKEPDLIGNLLNSNVDKDAIKRKFASMKIPQVTNSKKVLKDRVARHLDEIPRLLEGTTDMSEFYNRAKQLKNEAPNPTLRQSDKYMIDWNQFFGGYYGVKRQFYISRLILDKYDKQINKISKRNATVAYWGTQDFSQYVLANEIIIRLAMEDYKVNFERASQIILKTAEYGSEITDLSDLEDGDDNGQKRKKNTSSKVEKPKKKQGLKLADLFG